jgi:hypothetical protein
MSKVPQCGKPAVSVSQLPVPANKVFAHQRSKQKQQKMPFAV